MTTSDKSQRTEAPTERRRERARNKGDIASSQDLTAGVALFAAALALLFAGETIGGGLLAMMQGSLGNIRAVDVTTEFVVGLARAGIGQFSAATALLIGTAVVASLASGAAQAGIRVSMEPLTPDLDRLNPVNGFSRIFSSAAAMRGLQGVLKVSVLTTILLVLFWSELQVFMTIGEGTLSSAVQRGWTLVIQSFFTVSIALIVMGISDYLFQRWRFESQLKMSRDEIKQERKEEEGDPHMRARIKRVQREMANNRMLRDVPTATVVITNPTHYAVALRYELHTMHAPEVVAKGVDEMALRIRRLAEQHDVPVLERRALARALYRSTEIGDEIPPELYMAVVEIVGYLQQIGKFG